MKIVMATARGAMTHTKGDSLQWGAAPPLGWGRPAPSPPCPSHMTGGLTLMTSESRDFFIFINKYIYFVFYSKRLAPLGIIGHQKVVPQLPLPFFSRAGAAPKQKKTALEGK